MIKVQEYRGHIRNWEELCERLGISLLLPRKERETEDGTLLYGTTIRKIMEQPGFKKELNEEMLQLYLSLTYVAGENTFFRGLKKLMPGRYLIWKDGVLKIERYWSPQFHPDESKNRSYPAAWILPTCLQCLRRK